MAKRIVKCPECGEQASTGQDVATIGLSDGSSLDVLVSVVYCTHCDEYCEVENELA